MSRKSANRLLGYPDDARLLIINADDFGMCSSVNEAIMHALRAGVVRSTTLMVPCPWAPQAMHFLADHPEIPFGVHLTVISDTAETRWGPVAPRDKVASLVDRGGCFFNFEAMPELLAQVDLAQLEMEFRAQIEAVLGAGLRPTHLDWHALRISGRREIFEVMIRLAIEYRLALRVMGRSLIEELQREGLPTSDYDFLDSYLLDPVGKTARYAQLLRELPPGLSEWAVHPGLDNPELQALEPAGSYQRQADFDFWTSQQAADIVKEEAIILLDYRGLQAVWSRGRSEM